MSSSPGGFGRNLNALKLSSELGLHVGLANPHGHEVLDILGQRQLGDGELTHPPAQRRHP